MANPSVELITGVDHLANALVVDSAIVFEDNELPRALSFSLGLPTLLVFLYTTLFSLPCLPIAHTFLHILFVAVLCKHGIIADARVSRCVAHTEVNMLRAKNGSERGVSMLLALFVAIARRIENAQTLHVGGAVIRFGLRNRVGGRLIARTLGHRAFDRTTTVPAGCSSVRIVSRFAQRSVLLTYRTFRVRHMGTFRYSTVGRADGKYAPGLLLVSLWHV